MDKREMVGMKGISQDVLALRRVALWFDLSTILKETKNVFGSGTAELRRVVLYLSHRLNGVSLRRIGNSSEG